MDPRIEEAVQRLTDAGFTEEEALANLEFFTNREDLLDEAQTALDATVEGLISRGPTGEVTSPVFPPGSPAASQPLTEKQKNAKLVEEGTERREAGLEPTEEQKAAEQTPGGRARLEEIILEEGGEQPYNWDWVYNDPELQILPGSLDSDVAMSELLIHFDALGVVDEADYADLSEEDKVTLVKETLTRSRNNQIVKWAVREWGRKNDVYTPEMMIDGVSTQDIGALMNRGLPQYRAESFGRIGTDFEVNPTKLYDIYENANQDPGQMAAEGVGGPGSIGLGGPVRKSPYRVAQEFKEGLELYEGSDVLAAVHVSDKDLAVKLKQDPYSLDSGELQRALDYIGGEEGTAESGDPQVNWLKERLAGGFQASANVQSEEDVQSALNTLASAWNMTGSEEVVAKVSRQLVSQAVASARAQLPNPFGGVDDSVQVTERGSPQALVESRLRQTGEYEELFGNLSPGESEQEYAARFDRATQRVLGDDVVSVSRNAMRSGNVNTAYQQAALTDVGESSTRFQEIRARNAALFREML